MRRTLLSLSALALVTPLVPALSAPAAATPTPRVVRVCPPPPAPDHVTCFAVRQVGAETSTTARGRPRGYSPADLRAAYRLPTRGGKRQTIAIVDAYDQPRAEHDLGVYRRTFGLPPCTTANRCFRKVNQEGQSRNYPRRNLGWGLEISLDLDMASAICPQCRLLLVEARTSYIGNMGKAVDTAVRMGATVVNNSYGLGERWGHRQNKHYQHRGVAITASTGDSGYGVQFPASSPWVTAVGGTTLRRAQNGRGWTETAWDSGGSGCSRYFAKPVWQRDGHCAKRAVADVAAIADYEPGVAVYNEPAMGGWTVLGGTSVAAPIIAGSYALAGNARVVRYGSRPYAHRAALFDIVSGRNGRCHGSYLCHARPRYDGPTGLGSPKGLSAF